ncbi:MAG: DUF5071 domain-containing protein [Calothrix sp. FI2-JRJ7]|jgi:hypothetical protein|nr:DUF5071 domain-containing protein [Calothrix sp. FI2-JRJ7]
MESDLDTLKQIYAPHAIEGISEELLNLLPREKDDKERVERIKELGYPFVKPIIPHLLTWLEDINWPVAGYLLPFFLSIREHIIDDIREILHGDNLVHIYWILEYLLNDPDVPNVAGKFKEELTSLAKQEDEEEVYLVAREILEWLPNS